VAFVIAFVVVLAILLQTYDPTERDRERETGANRADRHPFQRG
jgi:hypothetical protein